MQIRKVTVPNNLRHDIPKHKYNISTNTSRLRPILAKPSAQKLPINAHVFLLVLNNVKISVKIN
jgi:hypothetical protein